MQYCPSGGKEAIGGDDDLIARSDPGRTQGDDEGIRPGSQTDGVFDAQIVGYFLLESFLVRPEDEFTGVEHVLNSGVNFRFDRLVLRYKVK